MATTDHDTARVVTPSGGQVGAGDGGSSDGWAGAVVYTVGHSTRSRADFVELLRRHGIVALADVRTIPRSRRNPQFALEELSAVLPKAGIAYAHPPRGRRLPATSAQHADAATARPGTDTRRRAR